MRTRSGSGIDLLLRRCECRVSCWFAYLVTHLATLLSPGTLPADQNSPQKVKYDLYAEQVRIHLNVKYDVNVFGPF